MQSPGHQTSQHTTHHPKCRWEKANDIHVPITVKPHYTVHHHPILRTQLVFEPVRIFVICGLAWLAIWLERKHSRERQEIAPAPPLTTLLPRSTTHPPTEGNLGTERRRGREKKAMDHLGSCAAQIEFDCSSGNACITSSFTRVRQATILAVKRKYTF
ncbi:hypothetical protein BDQ17DRAFT_143965 [Cyathus striatus]|nr:hypothetical protein BDQ17DRAFT_143965 [Cyathus striatus]